MTRIGRIIGQPTPFTHPHLLPPGHLAIGQPASLFADRRKRLFKLLSPGTLALIPGYRFRYASKNIFYPFRQCSNVHWLSGYGEPDGMLLLEKDQREQCKFVMFVPEITDFDMTWTGPRCDAAAAVEVFGADEAHPLHQLPAYLKQARLSGRLGSPSAQRWLSQFDQNSTKMPIQGLGQAEADLLFSDSLHQSGHQDAQRQKLLSSPYASFLQEESNDHGYGHGMPGGKFSQIDMLLQYMRVFKDQHEISVMQRAADLAAAGFSAVEQLLLSNGHSVGNTAKFIRNTVDDQKTNEQTSFCHSSDLGFNQNDGLCEYHLAAAFQNACMSGGADMLAYTPVVASASNALVLHYIHNRSLLQQGQMVLMDAGAYFAGYNSDVTRTFAISNRQSNNGNGKTELIGQGIANVDSMKVSSSGLLGNQTAMTQEQAELYQAVLAVQTACIAKCSEASRMSLNDLHVYSVGVMARELGKLGFPQDEQLIESVLYPHSIGHYLGCDLHDCELVSKDIPLKANMVITVEPGVYVRADRRFPSRYHGIGIRIEDDVVIAAAGEEPLVLSRNIPK